MIIEVLRLLHVSLYGRKYVPVVEISASSVFDLYNILHKEYSQNMKISCKLQLTVIHINQN